MANLKSINPSNGEIVNTYDYHNEEEIQSIIQNCHKQYLSWSKLTLDERIRSLRTLEILLWENKTELALMATEEMGKTLKEAVAEIEKCSKLCWYYAENASSFLEREFIETKADESYISYQPIGVILGIMPWNFPYWQVFRFAIPNLIAGNGVLLKHSSQVTGCALEIEKILMDAGFPKNIFKALKTPSSKVNEVIKSPLIQGVSLTGSTNAGKKVAAEAGKYMKKTIFELGGSDPYIILADANLENAVDKCLESRLLNCGQSCIAAKRFIVEEKVYDDFVELMNEKIRHYKIGDPKSEASDLGPLSSMEARENLHKQVLQSIEKGARCPVGGMLPEGEGAFYPPTLLVDVEKGMAAYEEELFGPVAAVIKAKDKAEAIDIANSTQYGLGAGIFTSNIQEGRRIAEYELQAGSCFVNDYVKSDPRLPFGGIKDSGYGRELSFVGLREFLNCKTVVIHH